MAYYEGVTSCNCNPDIFALKGKNALGTNFIISAQTFLNNANYARSGFDIVATQSNTSITIVPSSDIVGHPAGVPFTIVLNMGETYSAEASNIAGNLHLSGSTVIANKPIAITIKDDSMSGAPYGGCADLMGDQTIPVPVTGKEYLSDCRALTFNSTNPHCSLGNELFTAWSLRVDGVFNKDWAIKAGIAEYFNVK
jgi:hypothetical protein